MHDGLAADRVFAIVVQQCERFREKLLRQLCAGCFAFADTLIVCINSDGKDKVHNIEIAENHEADKVESLTQKSVRWRFLQR